MISKIANVFSSFGEAMRRFPFVIIAAFVGAAAALTLNHGPSDKHFQKTCLHIILLALAGLPLFTGTGYLNMMRPNLRRATDAASLFILACIWFLIPSENGPFVFIYNFGAVMIAVAAFASAVPGLGGEKAWWRINVGTAQALILAAIVSGIVGAGLQTAIFSIKALFNVDTASLHMDAFLITALLFAPLAVIALLPDASKNEPLPLENFWKNLGQWVLAPLGLLFIAIIATYAGRILTRWDLPDGMVAMPVLALGAYGTAAMFLLQPWRKSHATAQWLGRIHPPAFLLSSTLLFAALAIRLDTYGMTFARYTALASAIWLVFAAVLFLFRIANSGPLIMAAAVLMALAGAFGPLSAGTLSLRSQSARLQAWLENPNREEVAAQMRSGIIFITENFGLQTLEKITGPLELEENSSLQAAGRNAANKLGAGDAVEGRLNENPNLSLSIAEYSKLYESRGGTECLLGAAEGGDALRLNLGDGHPRVMAGDTQIVDLLPLIAPALSADIVESPLCIPFTVNNREFLLVMHSAFWKRNGGRPSDLRSYNYFVLEK